MPADVEQVQALHPAGVHPQKLGQLLGGVGGSGDGAVDDGSGQFQLPQGFCVHHGGEGAAVSGKEVQHLLNAHPEAAGAGREVVVGVQHLHLGLVHAQKLGHLAVGIGHPRLGGLHQSLQEGHLLHCVLPQLGGEGFVGQNEFGHLLGGHGFVFNLCAEVQGVQLEDLGLIHAQHPSHFRRGEALTGDRGHHQLVQLDELRPGLLVEHPPVGLAGQHGADQKVREGGQAHGLVRQVHGSVVQGEELGYRFSVQAGEGGQLGRGIGLAGGRCRQDLVHAGELLPGLAVKGPGIGFVGENLIYQKIGKGRQGYGPGLGAVAAVIQAEQLLGHGGGYAEGPGQLLGGHLPLDGVGIGKDSQHLHLGQGFLVKLAGKGRVGGHVPVHKGGKGLEGHGGRFIAVRLGGGVHVQQLHLLRVHPQGRSHVLVAAGAGDRGHIGVGLQGAQLGEGVLVEHRGVFRILRHLVDYEAGESGQRHGAGVRPAVLGEVEQIQLFHGAQVQPVLPQVLGHSGGGHGLGEAICVREVFHHVDLIQHLRVQLFGKGLVFRHVVCQEVQQLGHGELGRLPVPEVVVVENAQGFLVQVQVLRRGDGFDQIHQFPGGAVLSHGGGVADQGSYAGVVLKLFGQSLDAVAVLVVVQDHQGVFLGEHLVDLAVGLGAEGNGGQPLEEVGTHHQHQKQQGQGPAEAVADGGHTLHGNLGLPLRGFCDQLVGHKDQAGQHGEDAEQAAKNPLGQHNAQVPSDLEAHEHQHQQAHKGGKGAAGDGGEGVHQGVFHGLPAVGGAADLLAVPVHQDDGVVHGEHQLQNGRNGEGNGGHAAHDQVGAHVDDHGNPDGDQENDGLKPGGAHDEENHHQQGQGGEQQRRGHAVAAVRVVGFDHHVVLGVGFRDGLFDGDFLVRVVVVFRGQLIKSTAVPVVVLAVLVVRHVRHIRKPGQIPGHFFPLPGGQIPEHYVDGLEAVSLLELSSMMSSPCFMGERSERYLVMSPLISTWGIISPHTAVTASISTSTK